MRSDYASHLVPVDKAALKQAHLILCPARLSPVRLANY